ncbi:MAG: hypothetical protein R3F43_20870 [bacterium]
MAHDDGHGQLYLADGRVRIRWPGVGKQDVFTRASDALKAAATALRGKYVPTPSGRSSSTRTW